MSASSVHWEPIPFPFSPIITMPRIRYSEDVKRQAVSLVVEDHFTVAEVAHEIGCSVFTLHAWLKKHRQSITPALPSNAPSFVPVHLVDAKTASVEIVTPGGFTLRLIDVSSQEIVELLTALATC